MFYVYMDSARHNNIVIVLVVLIFSNKYIAIFHYNNTIYCNIPLQQYNILQYSIITIQYIAIFHYNNTIYCNTILQCFKPPCRSHHSMHFTSILHIVLTLRPFLSGTLFRAYWSIFEYRMAGLTYLSGGYVHFLDVLTSL